MEKLRRAGKEQTVIGVRVKLFSIPPAHRKTCPERNRRGREAVPQAPEVRGSRFEVRSQAWQPHTSHLARRTSNIERRTSVPYDGTLREVLERKREQLKEVEGFLAEGLELGLLKFAEELKKDIEALRGKLGDGG